MVKYFICCGAYCRKNRWRVSERLARSRDSLSEREDPEPVRGQLDDELTAGDAVLLVAGERLDERRAVPGAALLRHREVHPRGLRLVVHRHHRNRVAPLARERELPVAVRERDLLRVPVAQRAVSPPEPHQLRRGFHRLHRLRPLKRLRQVERAAHGEVAVRPPGRALLRHLVAVVHAGHAPGEQQRRGRELVVLARVGQARVHAALVVVAQEVEHRQVPVHVLVALERVLQLPVVVVVQRRPQRLGELVVRAGVQQTGAHVRVVVAVHQLAQQRAVGLSVVARRRKLAPKIRRNLVRDVQAPPVDVRALRGEPEPAAFLEVRTHLRIVVVQLGKTHVALPPFQVHAVAVLAGVVPVPVPRASAVREHVARRKVVAAGVVEDAVQDDADAERVRGVHDTS
mmetsp:Transcript_6587/g.28066  ORF Transcript_6587/g.28066 Transcript_6587/m.28066 type:complete len:400 (+) Transcript_6587:1180-2379(+)